MITNSVSATSATSTASGAAPSVTATDPAAAQDRFLKLLVAQLGNQDPMNPMDNAQMTTQMAQINTVSGIAQVNQTLQSMAAQFSALQSLQGATMVGRDVLTTGSTLQVEGTTGKGGLDLSGSASNVKVEVLSAGGQVLDTLNLGSMSAGQHTFETNATAYNAAGTLSFRVTATQGSQAVPVTALSRDKVTSVGTSSGTLSLSLQGGSTVSYSDVKSVL
jgi:flagellar basal-body rod modification protein FlgD